MICILDSTKIMITLCIVVHTPLALARAAQNKTHFRPFRIEVASFSFQSYVMFLVLKSWTGIQPPHELKAKCRRIRVTNAFASV